jgi:hypothetical protein
MMLLSSITCGIALLVWRSAARPIPTKKLCPGVLIMTLIGERWRSLGSLLFAACSRRCSARRVL